jgi:ribonucleotide reductase beta subunit family protein with ferritin-like domain
MLVQDELLLKNTSNKYSIFPIQYPDIWKFFTLHKQLIWFVDDLDLTKDMKDWVKLTADEQFFIKHVLAFFAASDGIIMENISTNFASEIQIAEARAFYAMQMFAENEHSITYGRLIETYISDADEKMRVFNAIDTMPAISKKAIWAKQWVDSDRGFATRLVSFMIVEGLFFSGAFCSIYWIAERGIMPGLCNSNNYIARDEGLHCDFAIMLYNKYVTNKLSQTDISVLIVEAVKIEKEFVLNALPVSLLGMNSQMMSNYIEFIADRLMSQIHYKTPWSGVKNPFPFMDKICLQNQTSFFDSRPTEYSKDTAPIAAFEDINFEDDF